MLLKRSKGQADSVAQNWKDPIDTTGLDLPGIDPVFTTYVINKGGAKVGQDLGSMLTNILRPSVL